MRLFEFRLYKLRVIKDDNIVFEGMAEDLPEELKMADSKEILLENGIAIVKI